MSLPCERPACETSQAPLESRIQVLITEAAAMWRAAYGQELTDGECDDLSNRLLTAFGLDLPTQHRNCQKREERR